MALRTVSRLVFSTAAAVLVSACATTPPPVVQKEEPSEFELKLAGMATDVRGLLTQLNTLEQSRQKLREPPQPAHAALPNDHVLRRPITLTWRGDARVVLARLAEMSGLQFAVGGTTPVMHVVAVDAKNIQLGSVLEGVATQIGGSADVVFVEHAKTIELRFKGN